MKWIIGIDEVGRGPLAGPVYVCAAMMSHSQYKKWKPQGLTDSKKMSPTMRGKWFRAAKEMQERGELFFAVGKASASVIDTKGISVAIEMCIERALRGLPSVDSMARTEELLVLLDGGLKAPRAFRRQKTIIGGDARERIISLASVIAKVSRDAHMVLLSKKYPVYGWEQNKGYGTKVHRTTLIQRGPSPLHRRSYLTRIIDKM